MSDLAPFLTGLANGLDSYLGKQQQVQGQMAVENQRANVASAHVKEEQDAELNRQKALADYKAKLGSKPEATITADMAEQLIPNQGKILHDSFKQQNGRDPTVKEVQSFADMIHKDLGSDPGQTKAEMHQDALEKQYADRLQKVVAFRSGGLGLQDQKVNQAIDLRQAINQYYDPNTDTYNLPPTVHAELVVGLDRLLSSGGQMSQAREEELKQSTAREGIAKTLIKYGLANPEELGGPTQDVAKMLVHMIDRQGLTAETLRDKYQGGLKQLAPSGLSADRRSRLDKAELTNSFKAALSDSPDIKKHHDTAFNSHPLGKVTVISPKGIRGTIPAEQLDEALKAGYKQAK